MTRPVDAIVARIAALHPKRIDLSLDRIERLLAALDHPERRLPPVIHVAGTNGKGSTIAFMRAILEAAGKSVHVYSSPHLVRFNERYRLGAQPKSDISDFGQSRLPNSGRPEFGCDPTSPYGRGEADARYRRPTS
jgi:dihydrofolate synthase/folylpolyglutamate synthase